MSTADNLARVVAIISAVTAISSVVVSLLTYRRTRPKIVLRRCHIWTDEDHLVVSTHVVNRSSVTVPLAGDWHDEPPRVVLRLYPRWWTRRRAWRARGQRR